MKAGEQANGANDGEEDKGPSFPVLLQVRANRSYRTGELVLLPAAGEVREANRDTEVAIAKSKAVHATMLASVEAQVSTGAAAKKRRRIAEASSQEIYPDVHLTLHILSPLVSVANTPAKRKTCLENIAPFWALLQRAPEGGPANMALEYIRVRENAPDAAGWPVGFERAQRLANEVHIPMARTTRRIQEGDVLTLPFEAECVQVRAGVVEVTTTEGQTLKGTEGRCTCCMLVQSVPPQAHRGGAHGVFW